MLNCTINNISNFEIPSAEWQYEMTSFAKKPATYAHHVKELFSQSMDSSINELTNSQYTTAKC